MSELVAAIVVAAGRSRRMGGTDKLWIPLPLHGQPLLAHTIGALAACSEIQQTVVVASGDNLDRIHQHRAEPPWNMITALIEGGAARADSVYAGLCALEPCDIVLVHDGARPLVTRELIRAGIASARVHGAAAPVLPLTDTVKTLDEHGNIVNTVDRSALRAVQTPQVFRYDLLRRAYELAGDARSACTDDAMLLERLGWTVATFPGDPRNIKVTTPEDLPLLELYMRI